jgi:uncharacterized protein (TIGR02271 family)
MDGRRNTVTAAKGHSERESKSIPVVEERVRLDKKLVETDRVQAVKRVHEEEEIVTSLLSHDEFEIERIPVGRQVESAPPPIRYEGNTMIIPVLREEVIIQKRLVLVEEIKITKRQITSVHTEPVRLRKEEVIVEHKGKGKL